MTAKAAMDAADGKDFRPIDLPAKFEGDFKSKQTTANAHNVVGYIEGSDPVLKSEAIIFTAHYDGFGLLNGKIYNGAADNAIGNGEMLAVAEAFSKMKVKPRRSLIFLSTTSESTDLLAESTMRPTRPGTLRRSQLTLTSTASVPRSWGRSKT